MSYRYRLEPYSSRRRYFHCPRCGRSTLTLYIDTETGEYIYETVGRCRREQNCRYHLPPNEFFNQIKNNKAMNTEIKPEIDHVTDEALKQYASTNLLPLSQSYRSAMGRFLAGIDSERAQEVMARYDVRPTRNYRHNGLLGAAFIQRDIEGNVRNVKEMAYKEDGHRVRDGEECEIWDARQRRYVSRSEGYDGGERPTTSLKAKRIMWRNEFVGTQCFFGEHLLRTNPDSPVLVVESEKSALVVAMMEPDSMSIATGGKYGCRLYDPEVNKVLKGREVILCPDLGAEAEWESAAEEMANAGIDVSIFSLDEAGFVTEEDRENGLDVADYLLRAWRLEHPEPSAQQTMPPTSTVKRASLTGISTMLSTLSESPATVVPDPPTAQEATEGQASAGWAEIDLSLID